MKKEDKVPPFKSGEGEREDPLTPQPEPLPDSPDVGAENDEPNSEGETGRIEEEFTEKSSEETELPVEPELLVGPKSTTPSPQKKKSSGKIFLVLFLGFLLTGLSASVYFLVEERSKTFLEIQEKLAHLDSKLGAIQTGPKDSGQIARDLASLQQEFQTFREQVSESLASRQTPVAEPPTSTEEPDEVEEQETATHSNEVASQIDQVPTESHQNSEPTHDLEPHQDSEPSHDSEPTHDLEIAPDHEPVPLEEDTGNSKLSHDEVALEHPQPSQPLSSHKPAHKPEELPGEQVERSAEVQQYINFVESTAAKLFGLAKKGSNTAWDYLIDLLG